MNLNSSLRLIPGNRLVALLVLVGLFLTLRQSQAAPTIVSTVPANMATGVSPTAPIVFTFSEAMNTAITMVTFMDMSTAQSLIPSAAWSVGNTVLTCTPVTPWTGNHMIMWTASGRSAAGIALTATYGFFTSAAAGTGCDTNAPMLSFTVAKGWMYGQTSASAPALNASSPYCFVPCMSLPCPRDATNVTLQLPAGGVYNMALSSIPGHLTLIDCSYINQTAFEAAYPSGNYTFNVQSVGSNQPVTVNLPPDLTQPPAPRLTNYLAGQAINPAQPFVLAWDPFTGGTTADRISVEIYGGVFRTPTIGEAGGLNGTATAVVIPAGTFQPNHQYSGCVSFYHYRLITNGTAYLTLTYRCSTTEFNLATGSGSVYCPVITNAGWAGVGKFRFDVLCSSNQTLVVERRTNMVDIWKALSTNNSTSQSVPFTDPGAGTNPRSFYRVRTSGP